MSELWDMTACIIGVIKRSMWFRWDNNEMG
jgi:hypothetical protein